MQQQSKLERHVSSVTKSGGRGAGGGGGSLVDGIKGGSYLHGQFSSLTQEEKDRVAKYRADANKKKKLKKAERRKRGSSQRHSLNANRTPMLAKVVEMTNLQAPMRVRSLARMATKARSGQSLD
jgi:hypothetical protein